MATSYKTPGVYIEEIVKFPPSVAQVETAIPAFIGYTSKATKKEEGDLHLIPKRITSMLDYVTFFGYAKNETSIGVSVIDAEIVATSPSDASKSPFLMYYALQMYFANGGGPCYIVSVGQYSSALVTTVVFSNLNNGLIELEKEDEPTLIVFPDATSLAGDDDFYALYNNALMQCNKLQDRFTIIDTYRDSEYSGEDPIASIRLGINLEKDYLKYGAVYYPYLETILDYAYDESQIDVVSSTATGASVRQQVQDISSAIDTTTLATLFSDLDTLEGQVDAAINDAVALALIPNLKNKVQNIIEYIKDLETNLDNGLDIARADGSANTLANTLDTWITDTLGATILGLDMTIDRLNSDTSKTTIQNEISSDTTNDPSLRRVIGIHDDNVAGDSLVDKINDMVDPGGELALLIAALPNTAPLSTSVKLNTLEATDNALYNKIKAEIGLLPVKLPPSSSIAGVYARVDNDRGVWKAPANVGLNYVIKPSVKITNDMQDGLNVDTVAGKSINAIRSFTGKGTLVWGSRTLAGNDNEWRYVPVRRFFNMAEESIKKATEQFVFEPNDANTWIRVRAMIENFLILQWRAGALAGAKPDQAFYVRVGLGQTMTAEDILNGYMIIEIGMAVVRPAEFIILQFSHKMQEA
jgi:phage tail sheath protein FI